MIDDGIDQDCSGLDTVTCLWDWDGDGYGGVGTESPDADGACLLVDNQSTVGGDCDDSLASIYPGALEIADDGLDQNCDGADAVTCFEDGDTDGFGGALTVDIDGDCLDDPGQTDLGGDCDDTVGTVWPNAPEVLDDGVDQDCNGFDSVTCWYDGDGDGDGVGGTVQPGLDGTCDAPNLSETTDDCDDSSPIAWPGADEVCNGADDDCDGVVDAGSLAAFFPAGGTAHVTLPPLVPTTGAITVEAWVQARASDWLDAPAVFKLRPNAGSDVWLGAEQAGALRPVRSLVFGFSQDVVLGGDATPFTWRHIAATHDGSEHNLYVDGVLVGTSSGVGPLSLDPTGGWVLGASLLDAFGVPLDFWYGAIDDVRIWQVARTEAEFAQGRCDLPDVTDPDLLAWWLLDSDVVDATGNGNDGTLVGAGLGYFGR